MTKKFELSSLFSLVKEAVSDEWASSKKIERALRLAFNAHEGQLREHVRGPEFQTPYIVHPVGVALICAEHFKEANLTDTLDDVIAAALLHDVLEDSDVSVDQLASEVGERATQIVVGLTKPTTGMVRDRDQRNRRFIRQISEGGPTTKYIKVADSIHNLSRPESMPEKLLRKSIAKAKRDYLPLADDERLPRKFKSRFLETIAAAKLKLDSTGGATSEIGDLQNFFHQCFDLAKGKVLEAHDVLDVLLELPGLKFLFEGSRDEFASNFLAEWLEGEKEGTLQNAIALLQNRNVVPLEGKPFAKTELTKAGYSSVVAIKFDAQHFDNTHEHFFFFGADPSTTPEWLDQSTLQAITTVLAERYRDRRSKEIGECAGFLRLIDLNLDPNLALQADLSQQQLLELRELQREGLIVQNYLDGVFHALLNDNHFDKVLITSEKRLKSPNSIIERKLTRNINPRELPDLVGFRFVFLDTVTCDKFARILLKLLSKPSEQSTSSLAIQFSSLASKRVTSASGYSATHLGFSVGSTLDGGATVSCEVQLKTICEDTWAKVSHTLMYKSLHKPSSSQQKALKKLSASLADAQLHIEGLLGSKK